MKIMIIGDAHFADKAPSSCTDSYTDDLFVLMRECVRLARELDCTAVVQAGDLVHIKTPGRTSHQLVQRIIGVLREFHCPVFVVPGNHDMTHDRFESIFTTQPLGVILRSGAAGLLSGWNDAPSWLGESLEFADIPHYEAPALPLYGVPWLQDWNAPAEIADSSVGAALKDLDRLDGSVPTLLVTHAPFYPPGRELKYEFYDTGKFASLLPSRTSVYYGHIHEAHGIYTSGSRTFCNMGALSRGSLAEHNLTREIGVAVWDSLTGLFEAVPVPHRPAAEVFRLTEVSEAKSVQRELDEFLRSVGASTIEITSVESVIDHVRGMNLPEAVTKIVEELLEGAHHDG